MKTMSARTWALQLLAVLVVGLSGFEVQAASPTVAGKFLGNGKPAKLASITIHNREAFADKESLMLVISEKDHSKDKKPDWNASFGRFGSALIISFHKEDGGIFGCEVSHAAHENQTFSSVGTIKIEDYKVVDGVAQGRITTGGQQEFFKKTWEVDLTFSAPVPIAATVKAKPEVARPADKPVTKKPQSEVESEPSEKPLPKSKVAAIAAKDLPIGKDATDLVYKKLVGHITYKSPADVKTETANLVRDLEKQGWNKKGSDLITPKSVILHRTRGDASLTIFVKPAVAGSAVQMMTTGLDWEGLE